MEAIDYHSPEKRQEAVKDLTEDIQKYIDRPWVAKSDVDGSVINDHLQSTAEMITALAGKVNDLEQSNDALLRIRDQQGGTITSLKRELKNLLNVMDEVATTNAKQKEASNAMKPAIIRAKGVLGSLGKRKQVETPTFGPQE